MPGGSIKGITIEIAGDSKGLTTALHGINKDLKDTQTDLNRVNKLLKLDPKNTELLAQKQRLLSDAIAKTKDKLATLKEAAKQAQDQLARGDISQAQYDALQREIIQTENSLRNLESEADRANSTLAKIGDTADRVAAGAKKIADKTKPISAAAAGALASIAGMAYSAVTGADDLNTLAKQTGFTTAELQKMQYASDLVDVSVSDITGAAAKLKKNMTSTSDATQEAFNRIGVSVSNADGSMRNINDVFYDVLQGLSGIENETERDQIAMQLFGKSADSLAGIIDDGGKALKEYGNQAEELGLILDQDTLDSLNSVNDQIDTLKANAKFTFASEGAKAMEALTPVFNKVVEGIGKILSFLGRLDSKQIQTIVTILAVVAAISPVFGIISKVASGVSNLMKVITILKPQIAALNAVLAANPIILIVMAIAALIAAFVLLWNNSEAFRNFWITLWDAIKAAAVGVADAVSTAWTAVSEWFSEMWDQVKTAAVDAWNGIKSAWATVGAFFQQKVNAIKAKFTGFKNIGSKIVNDIKQGISDAWGSLTSWFEGLWNNLFGNRRASVTVDKQDNTGGSNALGMSYVPFSGYLAQLHKGEAVLTAGQAREWRSGNGGGGSFDSAGIISAINSLASSMNVNVSLQGDARQLFKQVRQENNRLFNSTGYNPLGRSY